jgi:flagellar basal-body rod protein FlgB
VKVSVIAGHGCKAWAKPPRRIGADDIRTSRPGRSGNAPADYARRPGKGLPAALGPWCRAGRRSNWHALCCVSRAIFAQEFAAVADNTLFGVHGNALEVRSQRMGVLASNIANASTPGFKAKDIDFQSALSSLESGSGVDSGMAAATKYRVPNQPSMDGNTVELSSEQTAFAENAVQYQTTLSFLNGRIAQVTRALKGE